MDKGKYLLLLALSLWGCLLQANDKRSFDIIINDIENKNYVLACQAPEFSFHLPQMAGNFRIGFSLNGVSLWSDGLASVELRHEKNKLNYILQDPLFGEGKVTLSVIALTDTDGLIAELQAEDVPEGLSLIWSFGGSYGKVLDNPAVSYPEPIYCRDNVFSVEHTSFTVYYGESMDLKVFMGVTPLQSEIRLSDAYQQQTPLQLFNSGKKTEAPVLAGRYPVENGRRDYFCFYLQNERADYNYYRLPALFGKASGKH